MQALTLLEDLGALVPEQQALTPLGRHLAALPLPPRMGKLLLYAIMFACLDPLLTVACFAAFRCPPSLSWLAFFVVQQAGHVFQLLWSKARAGTVHTPGLLLPRHAQLLWSL